MCALFEGTVTFLDGNHLYGLDIEDNLMLLIREVRQTPCQAWAGRNLKGGIASANINNVILTIVSPVWVFWDARKYMGFLGCTQPFFSSLLTTNTF